MGRPRKYFTEEERKAAMKAKQVEWYQKNKADIAKYQANWRETHQEYKHNWNEANKDKIKKYKAVWRESNKDKITAYYQNNKDKIAKKYQTKLGRASHLVSAYRITDKTHCRGECTIDAQWIVDNIFSGQVCHYCGETDWMKLGCDRIDNSLSHTPENCVPCCWECNKKRNVTLYHEFMKNIGKIV